MEINSLRKRRWNLYNKTAIGILKWESFKIIRIIYVYYKWDIKRAKNILIRYAVSSYYYYINRKYQI